MAVVLPSSRRENKLGSSRTPGAPVGADLRNLRRLRRAPEKQVASDSSEKKEGRGLTAVSRRGGVVALLVAAYLCVVTSWPSKEAGRAARESLLQLEPDEETTIPVPKIGLPKAPAKLHLPSFPLGGGLELWHSLRQRRWVKKQSAKLSERARAREAEKLAKKAAREAMARAEGARRFRGLRFWGRAMVIYFSYKKAQVYCALAVPLTADEEEREALKRATWEEVHALNSDRLLDLCLDLRGFYLKSGQFLGTRSDFMPPIYLEKLGRLHDAVPPMAPERVRAVVEGELHGPIEGHFTHLDLEEPLGSASISQVHKGVLIGSDEPVAVKVQYPGAERVMMSDLTNLSVLASFLQKFELNFDVLSSVRELSRQIKHEFDFTYEARVMDRMRLSLQNHVREGELITVPSSIMATKRLLVMSFVEGQSLASIKRGEHERFSNLRRRIGARLLQTLADAWGYMIFGEGLFNADLHPGNIVIMPEGRAWGLTGLVLGLLGLNTPKLRVGLLDWGQVKELDVDSRTRFARLVIAISDGKGREEIVEAFKGLGIVLENPDDSDSIEKLALVMFDTKPIAGLNFNPFSEGNVLKLNSVKQYPQDLYFVLRAALMFRGMAQSLKVEFSLADIWEPHAVKHLKDYKKHRLSAAATL